MAPGQQEWVSSAVLTARALGAREALKLLAVAPGMTLETAETDRMDQEEFRRVVRVRVATCVWATHAKRVARRIAIARATISARAAAVRSTRCTSASRARTLASYLPTVRCVAGARTIAASSEPP